MNQERPQEKPSFPALGRCQRLHLQLGWWSLLLFLSLGFVLELLHSLKIGWYLEPSNETRRLMWTLAHAHGTLLSLVHLALAAAVGQLPKWDPRRRFAASRSLISAGILIPGGFLLGGITIYQGDPGLGILLLPPGAFLLFVAVALTASAVGGLPRDGGKET